MSLQNYLNGSYSMLQGGSRLIFVFLDTMPYHSGSLIYLPNCVHLSLPVLFLVFISAIVSKNSINMLEKQNFDGEQLIFLNWKKRLQEKTYKKTHNSSFSSLRIFLNFRCVHDSAR